MRINVYNWKFHLASLGLWMLNCIYGIACCFGPLIMSGLDQKQQDIQGDLILSIFGGVVIPPVVYISALFFTNEENWKWSWTVSLAILCYSIFLTVSMYN